MKIKFWGVRGSIPVPGPDTVRYGGNTTCIEVLRQNGDCIIFDAGSGIRLLGLDLLKRGKLPPIHLFITHTHWDHIQGFPFFLPCYIPGTIMHVKGPVHFVEDKSLQSVFDMQMKYEFFPISNQQLAASIDYQSISQSAFELEDLTIRTQFVNHPILTLGYRVTENGRTFVFTADHEPYQTSLKKVESSSEDALFGEMSRAVTDADGRFINFIKGANLMVVDCQYTPDEYRTSKRGWGHSSWDYCLNWMKEGSIERMVLTHHDPLRTDQALEEMLASARAAAKDLNLDPEAITLAQEGVELDV